MSGSQKINTKTNNVYSPSVPLQVRFENDPIYKLSLACEKIKTKIESKVCNFYNNLALLGHSNAWSVNSTHWVRYRLLGRMLNLCSESTYHKLCTMYETFKNWYFTTNTLRNTTLFYSIKNPLVQKTINSTHLPIHIPWQISLSMKDFWFVLFSLIKWLTPCS